MPARTPKTKNNENIDKNQPSQSGSMIDAAICNSLSILLTGKNSNDATQLASYSGVNMSLYDVINNASTKIEDIMNSASSSIQSNFGLLIDKVIEISTALDILNDTRQSNFDQLMMITNDTNMKLISIINKIVDINSNLKNVISASISSGGSNAAGKLNIELNGNANIIDSLKEFVKNLSGLNVEDSVAQLDPIIIELTKFIDSLSKISNQSNVSNINLNWIFNIINQLNTIKTLNIGGIKLKLKLFRVFLLDDIIGFRNEIDSKLNEASISSDKDAYLMTNSILDIFSQLSKLESIDVSKSRKKIKELRKFIVNDIIKLIDKISNGVKNKNVAKSDIFEQVNNLFLNIIKLADNRKDVDSTIKWLKKLKLDKIIKGYVKVLSASFNELSTIANIDFNYDEVIGKVNQFKGVTSNINKIIYSALLGIGATIIIGVVVASQIEKLAVGLVAVVTFYYGVYKVMTGIAKLSDNLKENETIGKINELTNAFLRIVVGIGLISLVANYVTLSLNAIALIGTAFITMASIVFVISKAKISDEDIQNINRLILCVSVLALTVTAIALISKVITIGDIGMSLAIMAISIGSVYALCKLLTGIEVNDVKNIQQLVIATGLIAGVVTIVALLSKIITFKDILYSGLIMGLTIGYLYGVIKFSGMIDAKSISQLKNLVIMSSIMLLVTVGVALISKLITLEDIGKSILIIGTTLMTLLGVTLISKLFSKEAIEQVKTMMIFGLSVLALVGIVVLIGSFVDWETLGKGLLVVGTTILSLGIMFKMINVLFKSKTSQTDILKVVGIIGMMTLAVAAVMIADFLLMQIGQFNIEQIVVGGLVMLTTVGVLLGMMLVLGLISKNPTIKTALITGAIIIVAAALITILMTYAVKKIVELVDVINEANINENTLMNGLKLVAFTAELALAFTPIGALSVVVLAGAVTVLAINKVMKSMVETINLMSKMPKNFNASTMLKAIDMYGDIAKGIVKAEGWMILAGPGISKLIQMNIALGGLARTVSAYASLKYPTMFDEKGNPIAFENLNDSQFPIVTKNIQNVLTVVIDAIKGLMKGEYLTMFQEGLLIKSPFGVFVKSSVKLGQMIANLATGVQAFANLTYPTKWNSEGKPIQFENLNENKFDTVKDNIQKVLTVVIDAIKGLASGQYANFFKDGWITKSPYAVFMNSSVKLGQMIANLATGVQAFANLTYPTKWNSEGKPIQFENLNEDKFDTVKDNIQKVLTVVIGAIKGLMVGEYAKFFEDGWFTKSPYAIFMNSSVKLGQMVASLATGVQSFANLTYPIDWDSNGKPIKFKPLTREMFWVAKKNIQDTLTTVFNAIKGLFSNPYYNEMFQDGLLTKGPFRIFMENSQNLGSLVAGIAEGIKSFAAMLIPIEWDETGKPINFITIGSDKTFARVKTNIASILTTVFNAITDMMKGPNAQLFETGIFKKGPFEILMQNSKGMGQMISGIAQGVVSFANLKVPGKYDPNMKPQEYLQLQQNVFNRAQTNIQNILTTIFTAISNLLKDPNVKDMLDKGLFDDDTDFGILMSNSGKLTNLLMYSAKILAIYSNDSLPTKVDKFGNVIESVKFNSTTAKTNIIKGLSSLLLAARDFTRLYKNELANYNVYIGQIKNASQLTSVFKTFIPNAMNVIESLKELNVQDYQSSFIPKNIKVIKLMLIDLSDMVQSVNTFSTSTTTESVNKVASSISDLYGKIKPYVEMSPDRLSKNVNYTKQYIKAINTLNVSKADKLIALATQMNKLAMNMGIVQNVFSTFTTKLTAIVNTLVKNLISAEKAIKNSDKIQQKRKELIDKSIEEIKELMDKQIEVQISNAIPDDAAGTGSMSVESTGTGGFTSPFSKDTSSQPTEGYSPLSKDLNKATPQRNTNNSSRLVLGGQANTSSFNNDFASLYNEVASIYRLLVDGTIKTEVVKS